MNKSEDITLLAVALNKLQAEVPAVEMNKTNSFFNSRYADLGSVINSARPSVASNGFSILQFPVSKVENGIPFVGVNTILLHTSGQFIEESIFIPIGATEEGDKDKTKKAPNYPQKAGITISYLRRYGWISILGMYSEEDTDGNMSTGNETEDVDVAEILRKKKQISTIFKKNESLQDQYKKAMTDLGYNNDTTSMSLIDKVIKKLESIKGE